MKASNDHNRGDHKCNLRSTVSILSYFVLWAAILAQPASALITDAQCEEIRNKAKEANVQWFGLSRNGKVTPLSSGVSAKEEDIYKIVHLHFPGGKDSPPTIVGVKITFHTLGNERDKNFVRVKNNFKYAFSVTFKEYQAFHNGENDFAIKTNFHLSTGPFNPKIPFNTFTPSERRNQLRYADIPDGSEVTFRSYLFTLNGVQSIGTCVDFAPVLPDATKKLGIEFIDLHEDPETAVFPFDSLNIVVSE